MPVLGMKGPRQREQRVEVGDGGRLESQVVHGAPLQPAERRDGIGPVRLLALPQVADPVEEDRQQDRAADEAALPERIDAQQAQAVADDLDQR